MKKIYYSLATLLAFLWVGCTSPHYNDPEEDYDILFPFEGIESPEIGENEVVIKTGNPDITKYTFQYQGNTETLNDIDYIVTVNYLFREYNNDTDHISSRYTIRYINQNKQLVSISSDPTTNYLPREEYEKGEANNYGLEMRPGKNYTKSFRVKSGFELLLCVNGSGPRGSSIVTEIEAVAIDGSIAPIHLSSEQYQNAEGIVQLPIPYCKYVILP